MICNACSQRNAVHSKFCRHCGARLDLPGASRAIPEEEFQLEPLPEEEELGQRVASLLDRAFALSDEGDIAGAAYVCAQAVKLDPTNVSAHSLMGLLYERLGRRQDAIAEYSRVIELNPDSAADRENLRRLRGELGGSRVHRAAEVPPPNRSAQAYFTAAPVVAAATLGIIMILLASNLTARSARSQGATKPVQSYVEQGKQAYQKHDYENAKEAFRTALLLDPNDSQAKYWLARTLKAHEGSKRRPAPKRQHQAKLLPATQPSGPAPPSPRFPTPPTAATPGGQGNQQRAATPAPVTPPSSLPAPPVYTQPAVQPLPPVEPVSIGPRDTRPTASAPPEETERIPRAGRDGASKPVSRPPSKRSSRPAARRDVMPRAGNAGQIRITPHRGDDSDSVEQTPPSSKPVIRPAESSPPAVSESAPPAVAPAPTPAPAPAPPAQSFDGWRRQQTGRQLEKQHDYAGAYQAYIEAKQAYQRQLDAGVRVQEARDGLRSCESAIEVCKSYLRR